MGIFGEKKQKNENQVLFSIDLDKAQVLSPISINELAPRIAEALMTLSEDPKNQELKKALHLNISSLLQAQQRDGRLVNELGIAPFNVAPEDMRIGIDLNKLQQAVTRRFSVIRKGKELSFKMELSPQPGGHAVVSVQIEGRASQKSSEMLKH
jgi:hypothetical protein